MARRSPEFRLHDTHKERDDYASGMSDYVSRCYVQVECVGYSSRAVGTHGDLPAMALGLRDKQPASAPMTALHVSEDSGPIRSLKDTNCTLPLPFLVQRDAIMASARVMVPQ